MRDGQQEEEPFQQTDRSQEDKNVETSLKKSNTNSTVRTLQQDLKDKEDHQTDMPLPFLTEGREM